MKQNKKILFSLASIPVTTFLFPVIVVRLAPADAGMAISLLLLFAAYPIQSLIIGAFSGTDMRRIWYLSLGMPALTPLLFSLAFGGMIWEIWIYSVFYLFAGALGAAISALFTLHKRKKQTDL